VAQGVGSELKYGKRKKNGASIGEFIDKLNEQKVAQLEVKQVFTKHI
jgi:hypothetical protein